MSMESQLFMLLKHSLSSHKFTKKSQFTFHNCQVGAHQRSMKLEAGIQWTSNRWTLTLIQLFTCRLMPNSLEIKTRLTIHQLCSSPFRRKINSHSQSTLTISVRSRDTKLLSPLHNWLWIRSTESTRYRFMLKTQEAVIDILRTLACSLFSLTKAQTSLTTLALEMTISLWTQSLTISHLSQPQRAHSFLWSSQGWL